jgi:hypothetical protein
VGVKLKIVKPKKAQAVRAVEEAMARYGITAEKAGPEWERRRAELLAPKLTPLTVEGKASLTYVVKRGDREIAEFENEDNAIVFRDAVAKGESHGKDRTEAGEGRAPLWRRILECFTKAT